MPLSEHEQRVLEQIERALYADDPKFAATVRGIDPHTLVRRRIIRAAVGVLVGLALLPVGIAVQHIEITLAGFLIALLSAWYGISAWRRAHDPAPAVALDQTSHRSRWSPTRRAGGTTTRSATGPTPSSPTGRERRQHVPLPKSGVMQRFEARWNRRRENNFGS